MKKILFLMTALCIEQSSNAQLTPTTNSNLNYYPYDVLEAGLHVGKGKVGIGPTLTTGGQTFLDPQELLHIHGWNVGGPAGYQEPTLRVSLEETADPSRIYGFLTMKNVGAGVKSYSAIAQNKYDLILGTSYTFNPTYENSIGGGLGCFEYTYPYNYDLVITSNNPRGSIRFGTTPPPPIFGVSCNSQPVYQFINPMTGPADVERMTILNNGSVGIKNNNPKDLLQIAERITFNDGEWAGMKYNQYFDISSPNPSNWKEKRFYSGTGGGINGIPQNIPPANILAKEFRGGMNIWAGPYETAGIPLTSGNNHTLWLSPGKLELWHDSRGTQFRVVTDIPADPPNNIPAKSGWAYFKNKVLIGTEGISDPNYKDPNNPWPEPTGDIDLTGLNATQSLKLAVNGLVLCKELIVRTSSPIPWPDYVFDKGYSLMPLEDVEKFVLANNHLPEMPSQNDIEIQGINVTDMQAKLLKKVEELTLYVIELKKELKELRGK